jgi:phi13 family phage major tail protein
MASIDMKYIVKGDLQTDGTYTNGKQICHAQSGDVNITTTTIKLPGDGRIVDSRTVFQEGTISYALTALPVAYRKEMLGHEVSEDGELSAKSNDIAPYLGTGFYVEAAMPGAEDLDPYTTVYVGVWYPKVKFAEPTLSGKTKPTDGLEYTTPTIEGTIYELENKLYHNMKEFATETAVKEWLNSKCGITTVSGGNENQNE